MQRKMIAVTGFWDPAGLGRIASRPADVYLRLFLELHRAVPFPMVIFIDPPLRERLEALLARTPALAERVVIERELVDLRFGRDLAKESFRRLRPPENCGPNKDTHGFAIVTWAKTDLVAEVCALRPDATHLMWLDFGLAHVGSFCGVDWRAIEATCPETPRISEMRAVSSAELADRQEYYRFIRGKVASGMFTVGRTHAGELAARMQTETDRMLALGRLNLEEAIFGILAADDPEIFSRWFANYPSVMANYTLIQGDAGCVLDNLRFCRDQSLHQRGVDIARDLVRAMASDAIRLHPSEVATLLHDAFICAYYADRDFAERLMDRITGLYAFSPLMRRPLDDDLLRTNIHFLGGSLDAPRLSWDDFATLEDFTAWKTLL